jgi:capsular polysaccharide biosynthesis protein
MKKHNRQEEFIVFNGEDSTGKRLGYEDQFNIFRRANLVIGPHGSGFYFYFYFNFNFAEFANEVCSLVFEHIPHLSDSVYRAYINTGLANILWMSPSMAKNNDCSQSPIVFEIVADTLTSAAGVQVFSFRH